MDIVKIQKSDPDFFLKYKNLYLSEEIKDFHNALNDTFNDDMMADILGILGTLLSKVKNVKRVYDRRKIYDIRRVVHQLLSIIQIMDARTALIKRMTYTNPNIKIKKYKSTPKKRNLNTNFDIPEEIKHLFS